MTNLEKFIGRPLDDGELSAIKTIMQLNHEKISDIIYARSVLHLIGVKCINHSGFRDRNENCFNANKTCFDCWMEEYKEVSK